MSKSIGSVMYVCLGNINRSAVAEWITKKKLEEQKLDLEVASSATSGYHIGDGASAGMRKAAKEHGYDLSDHKAQQVAKKHGSKYDLIIAMDRENMEDLKALFPADQHKKLALFCSFDEELAKLKDVPDPYYVGGYGKVVEIVEQGVDAILRHIANENSK